jgi:hypothetical protein
MKSIEDDSLNILTGGLSFGCLVAGAGLGLSVIGAMVSFVALPASGGSSVVGLITSVGGIYAGAAGVALAC